MDTETYYEIAKCIRDSKGLTVNLLKDLETKYPQYNHDTLYSILMQEYSQKMRMNHIKTQATIEVYFKEYNKGIEEGQPPGIILRMSEKFDVCPCLIAKLILKKYFDDKGEINVNISSFVIDTKLIPDMDLAYEIFLCTLSDNLYSPYTDIIKRSLGQQYEIKLYNDAKSLGLIFKDEEELRKDGYDKTPDIKLDVPVAVDGFIINWIESKALFGSTWAHRDYAKEQFLGYWNRFGPGLVIYWFGYCQDIVDNNDKKFIIRDRLSHNILHMKVEL